MGQLVGGNNVGLGSPPLLPKIIAEHCLSGNNLLAGLTNRLRFEV
jgi:hypothetical protein